MMSKFIGLVSAYAYAKSKGYTGTEEEFAILMAEIASVAETAVEAERIATESAQSAAAASSDVNRAAATVTQQAAQVHDDAETSSESAATASEAKETAVAKVLDSEAWAVGTRDGEDVGAQDETYHNNAKYYAESVSSSAQTATEAAQTATTKAGEAAQSASAAAESARTLTIDATLTQAGQAADAKVVGDEIGGIKEDIDEKIVSAYGKNRNTGNDSDGYLNNDGVLVPNFDWKTTDYCYVEDLTNITVSGLILSSNVRSVYDMFYACTYDTNKDFIANIGRVASPYAVGEGVAYIRFAYHPTYATDTQVEGGTHATAYEPFSQPTYAFRKSPYLDEYYLDRFNRYRVENNIAGSYINSSGAIVSSSNAVRCKVAVSKGDVVSICRTVNQSYATGAGLMAVCDASDNVLTAVDMSQYATIKYGTMTAVKYEIISDGAAYITFNVKMSNWDETNTTIVTVRDINTEYSGDYISEIEGYKLMPMNWKNGKWEGKKWVVVGDSLTNLNSRTDKYYYHYIADETAIDVYNMGDSGSGYAAEQDGGTAFYQRIPNAPTDADVITIFGSFNDLGTDLPFGTATDTGTTTIGGCMNAAFDALNTAYPLAVFGVISPTPWVGANPTNEPNRGSQYCDLLKQICENRSIPYLDLFHGSLLRPWEASFRELAYSKDGGNGVHPDETGHKIIAPRIKAFLETLLM
jgi:lysophospholipase L1-like esterase